VPLLLNCSCCCCINRVKCVLLLLKCSCCDCINRGFGELCAVVVVVAYLTFWSYVWFCCCCCCCGMIERF
jgi:hypothetical protein